MIDNLLGLLGIYVIIAAIYEYPPYYYLNYRASALYRQTLADLNKALKKAKLDEQNNKNPKNDMYKQIIKARQDEIAHTKELRDLVMLLIGKYQDSKKGYRRVLKVWISWLKIANEYAHTNADEVTGWEFYGLDKQVENNFKLTAYEGILKELSKFGDWNLS